MTAADKIWLAVYPKDEKNDAGDGKLQETVATAPSQKAVSDFLRDKPIKIVYPVVMAPYTFEDDKGEPQGFSIDLLRLWSKKTGIPIEFKSAVWAETLQTMRDGKADIHASLNYTKERDTYLDFATIVASTEGTIFFHKSITNISEPEDLRGYRVGVVKGGLYVGWIQENLPESSLVSYIEFPKMVDAVQKKEVYVFIDELQASLYRMKELGLVDEFSYNPGMGIYPNNFWIAARQGDSKLVKALKQGMALITPEERAAIERKWLTISTVKTQDTLFIAMYSDFAPYTFINAEGQPAGLFVDIWNLWAKKTGKKIRFLPGSWQTSLDNLKKSTADIHSGLFYSDSRAQWLDYSKPFYETSSYVFYSIKKEAPYKDGIYIEKKIGVIKGSYHEEHLRIKHPTVDVIPFESMEKMLRAVLSGEISACLTEYLSATAMINRLGLSGRFNSTEFMHLRQKLYAGVLKNNTQLHSLVKKGFDAITKNELAEIEEHWVTEHDKQYYRKAVEKISLTESETAWLKAHPDIVLGYTDTFEPEVIVNPDGSYQGIMVDFLDALNQRLGTRIRLRIDPVPELVEKTQKKEVDGILSLTSEYADKLGLLKTRGHVTNYPAVFARKDIAFEHPYDLAHKRVAIIDKVFFSEKIVGQYGDGATILKVKDALEGLQHVEQGRADLFLGASLNAYLITKYQLLDLTTQYVFYDDPIHAVIATRSDWPELSSILDKGLSSFSKKEIEAIVAGWSHLPEQQQALVELTPEEQAWLAQNHKVRVRIVDFPPFIIASEGEEFGGIAIDYLNLVAKRKGIRFSYNSSTLPFAEALGGLKSQKGPDLIGTMMRTPEREKFISFSKPYLSIPRVIFSRTDAGFISGIDDLFGKRVAVPRGTVVQKEIETKYPNVDLRLYNSDLKSLEAVAKGKADAYIGNLTLGSYLILKMGFTNLKVAAPTDLENHIFSFGIRKDWSELSSIIDKVLDSIQPAEKLAIRSKYLSVRYEHGLRPADVLKWILIVAGVGSGIVLLFFFWNRSLAKQVQERTSKLLESEKRFRATFEQAAVGITHVSTEGRFLRINQKFCDIVGYSKDEMLGLTFQDITHPDDIDADLEHVRRLLAGEAATYVMEKRYKQKNGESVWVNLTVSLLQEDTGIPRYFISAVEDITERKQAEQKIQEYQQRLKALASQLTVTEETERHRIAADLHDHVGQSLALARMQIAAANKSVSDDGLTAKLDDVSEILLRTVQDVRHLMFDLSSPTMHELGLRPAISEWLEEQIEKRCGIKTKFFDDIGYRHKIALDENVRAILFRNVRELLTNVVKHAQANQVSVSTEITDGVLTIVVQDDGVGFDHSSEIQSVKSDGGFGLFSIKERMADLGGTLEIESEPGKACRAVLSVPLDGGLK